MHPQIAYLTLTVLIIAAVAVAGCPAPTPGPTMVPSPTPGNNSALRSISSMAEIDAALASGPVVLEFGATWCGWCQLEKPVLEGLAGQYKNVSFLEVDYDSNAALDDAFYVEYIPQLDVIARKNADGSYLYIGPDGGPTTDRYRSRIVGYTETDALKPLVEAAITAGPGHQ